MKAMTPDEQARFDAAQAEVRALIKELDVADARRHREIVAAVKVVVTRLRRDQQMLLTAEFLKACTGEPPPVTERLCACGCGWPVVAPPPAKYATGTCRERAYREHAAANGDSAPDDDSAEEAQAEEDDPDCE